MVEDTPLEPAFSRRERAIAIALLLLVAGLTIFDVVEDSLEGASLLHTGTESFVVLVCLSSAAWLWARTSAALRRAVVLTGELAKAHADATAWRERSLAATRDLNAAIQEQLEVWGLTPAEQEVAFLLLKGMAIKEIAVLRATSERTVRQQAAAIYHKGRLEGRAHLAAFFLEELLSRGERAASV